MILVRMFIIVLGGSFLLFALLGLADGLGIVGDFPYHNPDPGFGFVMFVFFGFLFLCCLVVYLYFSPKRMIQRRLDWEEKLAAERRRREEAGR